MSTHKLIVGATVAAAETGYWTPPKMIDNACSRMFPGSNGLIQAVTNAVPQHFLTSGIAPAGEIKQIAVSTRIRRKYVLNGGGGTWAAGMADTVAKLKSYIDAGFDRVFYVEDHEPCEQPGGIAVNPPATYKTDHTMAGGVFATINGMTSICARTGQTYRSHIKVGHCQARQWVDGLAGRTWKDYDTGLGDFIAADMYGNSYEGSPSMTRNDYEPPATMMASFAGYKYSATDARDRMFFELGGIGLPFDTTGSARDAWIQLIHQTVNTWDPASKGWNFLGWIWWNTEGVSGNALAANPGPPASAAIGTKRYFQLDRRQDGSGGTKDGYVILNPPLPLNRWQQIATFNNH